MEYLSEIKTWFKNWGSKKNFFDDLAPNRNVDKDESYLLYESALLEAVKKENVKNIAITGPYGSGKSSLIGTFERRNKGYRFLKHGGYAQPFKYKGFKFLNISLASFNESSDELKTPFTKFASKAVENRLIERSILQQMLYRIDSKGLPYSRFKRISKPRFSLFKSLLVICWFFSVALLILMPSTFFYVEAFSPEYWVGIFLCIYSVVGVVILLANLYEVKSGVSLKKISLKNAEFEMGNLSEDSILNRHLDEIIYFFQETKYNVVVIEDVDRFGSPEIFIKLREINNLINLNNKTRKVTFIYALKDDMFQNKDRSKFFEFILPVLPIVNSTNSLDAILKDPDKANLLNSIERGFLNEISLYVSDMRLFKNICNEYQVYLAQMESDKFDKTKLFAMILYKNVYPNDFESLHYSQGAFYSIYNLKSNLIRKCQKKIEKDIVDDEGLIKSAYEELLTNDKELILLFFGALISCNDLTDYPQDKIVGITIDGNLIEVDDIDTWDEFIKLNDTDDIKLHLWRRGYSSSDRSKSTGMSLLELSQKLLPPTQKNIIERKKDIDTKNSQTTSELRLKISLNKKKRNEVQTYSLARLIEETQLNVVDRLKKARIDQPELLSFLIRHEYLDENYHSYISRFHVGSITHNDRDYLLSIIGDGEPDPSQVIDTPEVIINDRMKVSDFSKKHVLNVSLFDCLLEKSDRYQQQLNSALTFIRDNLIKSEDFLQLYWQKGLFQEKLAKQLSLQWPNYIEFSIENSELHAEHLVFMLNYVDVDYIAENMNTKGILTEYVGKNLNIICDFMDKKLQPEDIYSLLDLFDIKIQNLKSLHDYDELLVFVINKNLYEINFDNLLFLIERSSMNEGVKEFYTQNYTTIQKSGNEKLISYIDSQIDDYFTNIYMSLSDNTQETEKSIIQLLSLLSDFEFKQYLIDQQLDCKFETLSGIDGDLWTYVLQQRKVIFSWNIISDYLYNEEVTRITNDENSRNEITTDLLNVKQISDELKVLVIDDRMETSESLSEFIVGNEWIDDDRYRELIAVIPYKYQDFPFSLSTDNQSKAIALVDNNIVVLNELSFTSAMEYEYELLALLLAKNESEYRENKEIYVLDEDMILAILENDKSSKHLKAEAFQGMTSEYLNHSVSGSLFGVIYESLMTQGLDYKLYNVGALEFILKESTLESALKLLTKYIGVLDKATIYEMISGFPEPYKDIAELGIMPKIPVSDLNRELLEKLNSNDLISDFKVTGDTYKVITYRKRRE